MSSVGYDDALATLEIEFRNGGVYRYFAVPAAVHAALMQSASKGAFVSRLVRDVIRSFESELRGPALPVRRCAADLGRRAL